MLLYHVVCTSRYPLASRIPSFPYTSLFRSRGTARARSGEPPVCPLYAPAPAGRNDPRPGALRERAFVARDVWTRRLSVSARRLRSEEHTSELQSRENIVCRLLLEKKKYLTN